MGTFEALQDFFTVGISFYDMVTSFYVTTRIVSGYYFKVKKFGWNDHKKRGKGLSLLIFNCLCLFFHYFPPETWEIDALQ